MPTILVVEDRALDRKFLSALLRSAGYDVLEAEDALRALTLAQRDLPHLVISDILMPTVDGYEFVRRLREIPALASTPVLFYTATYHEREAQALARQCGAEVLTKPSDPKVILDRVAAALSAGAPPSTTDDTERFRTEHFRVVSSTLESTVRSFEASEQRMAAVVEIAGQLARAHDPDTLMTHVCAAARDVTVARQAVIGLLHQGGRSLRQVARVGMDGDPMVAPETVDLGSSLLAPAIGDRQTVRLRHPADPPERVGFPSDAAGWRSCLVVPIATAGRTLGYLALRDKLGAEEFSVADEALALTLATHAGIAFENAQLYEDLRAHTRALEAEVHERRRAETALREGESRTQFALEAAQIGIWEADLTSGEMTWSESLAHVFGLRADTMPSRVEAFLDLVFPEDRAGVSQALDRALAERADLNHEFRVVWPDGSVHWIAARARFIHPEAGARLVGLGIDINARKSLEEQLRHAQKMEAVGQLAGGVAHDFNNLLTAIRGYGDLVLEALPERDPLRQDVGEILKAADRAAGLTKQLLAFSRKQVLQTTLFDLNALVSETSAMLGRLIGEDIALVTRVTPAPAFVRADPGQIEQIILNLAVNARDAMPRGGRLAIETAVVDLDDTAAEQGLPVRAGRYIMLAVSDTGIGMDRATQTRVFEPFFTTKERGRGTGLGLAMVYGIVQQSDGCVRVYSELGHGSTFKVYLPQADSSAGPALGVTTVDRAPKGAETLMIVEDEDAVRSLSRLLLSRAGYRVLEAATPALAEALFERTDVSIDLLVTDVILPGGSGPDLFDRLVLRFPGLRVLYMSGYTDDSIAHHAGLRPGVAFLQKPFTAAQLLYKVREALDRG